MPTAPPTGGVGAQAVGLTSANNDYLVMVGMVAIQSTAMVKMKKSTQTMQSLRESVVNVRNVALLPVLASRI